ncbi:MAG: WD40 repeat domain-containing protein [Chloroflexi bacterium]|nr:WD40 repeat domain-containing protein [Chloroflexota bacterium]
MTQVSMTTGIKLLFLKIILASLIIALVAGCRSPGHKGWVSCVDYSPDGKYIATTSEDGTIKIWDSRSGKLIKNMLGHKGLVNRTLFSPFGKTLASCGEDGTFRLWDPASGKETGRYDFGKNIFSLNFSPDGKLIALGLEEGRLYIYVIGGNKFYPVKNAHEDDVKTAVFSPDGRMLASSGGDGFIKLWNIQEWLKEAENKGSIAAGSYENKNFVLVDAPPLTPSISRNAHEGMVNSIDFSPDGTLIASGGENGDVVLWKSTGIEQVMRKAGRKVDISSLAVSPDSRMLAVGMEAGGIPLYSLPDKKFLKTVDAHEGDVSGVAFTPDSKLLITCGWDGTAKIWDIGSGRLLKILKGHKGDVTGVAASEKYVVTSGEDMTARLWKYNGARIETFHDNKAPVMSAAVSPDGALLASGDASGTVILRSVAGNHVLKELHISIPESDTNLIENSLALNEIWALRFSPNGGLLAAACGDGTVRLWKMPGGEEAGMLRIHKSGAKSVVFIEGGRYLASGSEDDTIVIWDIKSGKPVKRLNAGQGMIRAIAAAGGNMIFSGGSDGSLKAWTIGESPGGKISVSQPEIISVPSE